MSEDPKKALEDILGEMAVNLSGDKPAPTPLTDLPPYTYPTRDKRPQVEVLPGVMVSQRLIDEAVRARDSVADARVEEIECKRIEHKQVAAVAAARAREELKNDLASSRQFLQAMVDRLRSPVNPDEKYVSYDAMPPPLQRIVKAYIDAEAANRELEDAIKALARAPITASPVANGAIDQASPDGPNEQAVKWSRLAGIS
jgi:hypothetical protein